MDKKAEAYQKYTGAAVAEMLIKVLPEVAGKIAEPLSQIDKITVIGGGEGSAIDPIAGNVPGVMAKLFESMKETTGIDLGEIVKANTYDAKVTRNVNFSGIPANNADNNIIVQTPEDKEEPKVEVTKTQAKKPEPQPKSKDKNGKMAWED